MPDQRFDPDPTGTELDHSAIAVADEVNRIQLQIARQRLADLFDPVPIRLQQDDVQRSAPRPLSLQVGQQLLAIRRRVDEDDFGRRDVGVVNR